MSAHYNYGTAAQDVIMLARWGNDSREKELRAALKLVDIDLMRDPVTGMNFSEGSGLDATVPLHVAVSHGCLHNVKVIVEEGADPNGEC